MRIVTFKLEDELVDELNKVSLRLGVSRSWIIRNAVVKYLQDLNVKKDFKDLKVNVRGVRLE